MTAITDPLPLPRPLTSAGEPRRVGLEIEFSGLTEGQVARRLARDFGGTAAEHRPGRWTLEASALGDFEIYLDSRPLEKLDRDGLGAQLREMARSVVPVEIVTAPLRPAEMARLDRALARLRGAGATGTRAGLLLGFGVHFNPEAVSGEFGDIAPVMTAYALLEDHLRRVAGIDMSRRVLPWVDPWPRALVDLLASDEAPRTLPRLIDAYLRLAPSRNHGLDMLCLFAWLDRTRVARVMDMTQISPRPTFHWRLPDCRIDEPDWSLAGEWNRWVLVETVAGDPALLARLRQAWRTHRASLTTIRADWAARVAGLLAEAGL